MKCFILPCFLFPVCAVGTGERRGRGRGEAGQRRDSDSPMKCGFTARHQQASLPHTLAPFPPPPRQRASKTMDDSFPTHTHRHSRPLNGVFFSILWVPQSLLGTPLTDRRGAFLRAPVIGSFSFFPSQYFFSGNEKPSLHDCRTP